MYYIKSIVSKFRSITFIYFCIHLLLSYYICIYVFICMYIRIHIQFLNLLIIYLSKYTDRLSKCINYKSSMQVLACHLDCTALGYRCECTVAAVHPASRCCRRSIRPPAIRLTRNCIRVDCRSPPHRRPVTRRHTIHWIAVVVSRISVRRAASPTARTRTAASVRRRRRLTISRNPGTVSLTSCLTCSFFTAVEKIQLQKVKNFGSSLSKPH